MEHGVQIGVAELRNVAEGISAGRRRSQQEGRARLRPLTEPVRVTEEVCLSRDSTGACAPPKGTAELLIRLFDMVGSLVILVFAIPVMLGVALLIKLTSRGPALYRQERVGKNGSVFTLYKFRTMINDAERHIGPVLAARDDDRVTPIGRILRRMRLDELPQLFNILCGEMSLVGPRPERPYFVARHKVLQGVRLSVKPGLTGLAQVRSVYDLKPSHKVRYDYLYIQRRSLLLNIYILLQTIPVLLARKGW
jgi:lipopolysaccharide/colanic/teichoic acid biosynthesis glycosyltransferase